MNAKRQLTIENNPPGNPPGFLTTSINQWKIKSVKDNQC
jgi:hypothetical protein